MLPGGRLLGSGAQILCRACGDPWELLLAPFCWPLAMGLRGMSGMPDAPLLSGPAIMHML